MPSRKARIAWRAPRLGRVDSGKPRIILQKPPAAQSRRATRMRRRGGYETIALF
jgi:hypothetical protein